MQRDRFAINEIFATIQGEATFTGTAAVFVRLQFCDVGCPWCDTKHTWERKPEDQVGIGQVTGAKDDPRYAVLTEGELVSQILKCGSADGSNISHVVFTGGEPLAHDPAALRSLTERLANLGYTVQFETSGTYLCYLPDSVFVTLSPKIGMPGGREVYPEMMRRANEIKLPVASQKDIDRFKEHFPEWFGPRGVPVWVQPVDRPGHGVSERCMATCLAACYEWGFRLSVQTHKAIGLP